mmetsp:Transcript_27001/g.51076  ORF Transcript_27001/g.51076 Transcript_27001/m.51076 type:complete len:219 (-) Transcript_27001:283-939(-)
MLMPSLFSICLLAWMQITQAENLSDLSETIMVTTNTTHCKCDLMSCDVKDSPDCAEGLSVFKAGEDPLEKLSITFKNGGGGDWSKVTNYQVKACFSDPSISDRPWRKKKDEISKNKQCLKKDIDSADWDSPSTSEITIHWEVKSSIPKAVYYVRVFAKDADGNHVAYGDSDVTSGFFKVSGYDGLEPGIVAGAVILSVLSWAILIGYFAYTTFFQKEA